MTVCKKRVATLVAVAGLVSADAFVAARTADGCIESHHGVGAIGFGHLGRNDSRRYGNDGVTQQHDYRGYQLPDGRDGGNIAIAYSGQRDDSPIDGLGDTGKIGIAPSFDQVHDRAENGDEQEKKKHEDHNLGHAGAYRSHEHIACRDEVVQAQDTEDPQQSKDAEDHQHLCSAIDKGYIGGKYGDEVYDAVKGKDVPPRFMKAVDTQDVFDGEYNGDNPLAPMQKFLVLWDRPTVLSAETTMTLRRMRHSRRISKRRPVGVFMPNMMERTCARSGSLLVSHSIIFISVSQNQG